MSEYVTVICERCGEEVKALRSTKKYCEECANQRKNEQILAAKQRKREKRLLAAAMKKQEETGNFFDLSGKSLAVVDAEAKALGLSYGQYSALVRSGGIIPYLQARGIDNYRKIIEEVDRNHA